MLSTLAFVSCLALPCFALEQLQKKPSIIVFPRVLYYSRVLPRLLLLLLPLPLFPSYLSFSFWLCLSICPSVFFCLCLPACRFLLLLSSSRCAALRLFAAFCIFVGHKHKSKAMRALSPSAPSSPNAVVSYFTWVFLSPFFTPLPLPLQAACYFCHYQNRQSHSNTSSRRSRSQSRSQRQTRHGLPVCVCVCVSVVIKCIKINKTNFKCKMATRSVCQLFYALLSLPLSHTL